MTAPAIDGRPLTVLEHKVMVGFARRFDIAEIAAVVGQRQEKVGEIVLDLCRMNREQAREIARRRHTLPAAGVTVERIGIVNYQRHSARGNEPLPPAELNLLRMLATDLPLRAISDRLGTKPDATRATLQRLLNRLNVTGDGSRAAAVTIGLRLGLITDTPVDAPAAPVDDPAIGAPIVAIRAKKTVTPRPLQPINHGTRGGYMAHARHKEPMCEPCREANAAVQRDSWHSRHPEAKRRTRKQPAVPAATPVVAVEPAPVPPIVPKRRRRQSDSGWWASLTDEQRAKAMQWATL